MDEYLCVTLLSRANEREAEFKARLTDLWTHMLRNHQRDFEKVYAESSDCEKSAERFCRRYLVECDAKDRLETQFLLLQMEYEPIDETDLYSKYEATPPEWFWIEH